MSNRKMDLHAWIVNPKTGELFAGFADSRGDVKVLAVDGEVVATGTLRNLGKQYNQCESSTGYPRVHTPDGVSKSRRGGGIGTVLYTALVCAAYSANDLGINVREDGAGICSSTYSRSVDADAWWDRAVDRYGIASRSESEEEIECEGYDVCIGKRSCDVYTYSKANKAGLVVMLNSIEEEVSFANSITAASAENTHVANPTALAALNTGSILATFGETRMNEAFKLMAFLEESAKLADVSARNREAMRTRFLAGVDGHAPVTGLEGTMTRENPSPKTRRTPKGYVVTRYGSVRRNPEDPAAVDAAVERAVDLRKKLGWGPWLDEKDSP